MPSLVARTLTSKHPRLSNFAGVLLTLQLETTARSQTCPNINKKTENFVVSEKILQKLNVSRGSQRGAPHGRLPRLCWFMMHPRKGISKKDPPYEFLQRNLRAAFHCLHRLCLQRLIFELFNLLVQFLGHNCSVCAVLFTFCTLVGFVIVVSWPYE